MVWGGREVALGSPSVAQSSLSLLPSQLPPPPNHHPRPADCAKSNPKCCSRNKKHYASPGFLVDVDTHAIKRMWGLSGGQNYLEAPVSHCGGGVGVGGRLACIVGLCGRAAANPHAPPMPHPPTSHTVRCGTACATRSTTRSW